MAEVDIFLAALRKAETDRYEGDYARLGGLIPGTQSDRALGAYGVPSGQWPHMASAAGYPGARWFDRQAQDAVVRTTIERLYGKYGDWKMVAVAWKAGEDFADAAMEDPTIVEREKTGKLRDFVARVSNDAKMHPGEEVATGIEGNDESKPQQLTNPFRAGRESVLDMQPTQYGQATPEQVVTGVLRSMRDTQRQRAPQEAEASGIPDTEGGEVSDGGLQAGE